jgi:hypothetical protein
MVPVYSLFWHLAQTAANYDSRHVSGRLDQGKRRFGIDQYGTPVPESYSNWTKNDLNEIGDTMMPLAMRGTAELFRCFYALVDHTAPNVWFDRFSSSDPNNPTVVDAGTIYQLSAKASDQVTGDSGVGRFKLETREQLPDGTIISDWHEVPNFVSRDGRVAKDQVECFVAPDHVYGFRFSAEDGAGNRAKPVEIYIRGVGPTSSCTGPAQSKLQQVSGGLTHSAEYYSNFVTAAYQRYLGRTPAPSEVAGWVGVMQSGLSDERLEASFIGAPEYIANRGGPGAGWVTGMYQDLLGRTPAPSEVAGWVNALNGGMAPAAVAYGFAAGPEREAQRITADYQTYLFRDPEPGIVAAWVNAFENGFSNEDVIAGFVGSLEYCQTHYNNYSGWLLCAYQDILGRDADAVGFQGWLQVLTQG